MRRVKDAIIIDDAIEYQRITVKLYGNGVVERDKIYGKDIGTKRQFKAKAGQLIISRIDARNGAFGVVPEELNGAIVTNDFWLFDVHGANVNFLTLVLASPRFHIYWQSKSNGTTNRQRVNEEDFLNCKIPLPDISEQNKLAQKYESTIAQAKSCEKEAELLEESAEGYLYDSIGIEPSYESNKRGSTILQKIRYKEVLQWGYDKNSISFPYNFLKYPAYSFKTIPKWCISLVRGKSPTYAEKSEHIILNQKCNRWDEINLNFAKAVNSSWIKKVNGELFTRLNDILINSTGEGTLGRASLVKEKNHIGLLYDSHMLCLRVDQKYVNPQLLVFLINSSFGQRQIEIFKGAQATKQTELGVENMKKLLFPLPDLARQNEISDHISDLKSQIKFLRQKAESLKILATKEFEEAVFSE